MIKSVLPDLVRIVRISALSLFILALLANRAFATADFYGVQMKSEDFARDIAVRENNIIPDFTNDRPGTNKQIYAQAYTSSTIGAGRGVSVHVFNHSDHPLSTEKLYRELTLVTREGERYDRSESEMMLTRDQIEPGKDATFNFTFPGIRVPREEVAMIICSFGLGETKIFLFPMPREEEEMVPVKKDNQPSFKDVLTGWNFLKNKSSRKPQVDQNFSKNSAPTKPEYKTEKKIVKKTIKKTIRKPVYDTAPSASDDTQPYDAKHPVTAACQTPIKIVQNFFRGVSHKAPFQGKKVLRYEDVEVEEVVDEVVYEKVEIPSKSNPMSSADDSTHFSVTKEQMDKELPKVYPLVKSEQVVEGVKYNFGPDAQRVVREADAETRRIVATERPWTLEAPPAKWERKQRVDLRKDFQPRARAEVVVYDAPHNFIIFNAGLEDGFNKDMLVDVLRGGKMIAKAMIVKPRDHICGALLLPEWRTAETVKVGDLVGIN